MKQPVRFVLTLVLCLILSLSGVLAGTPAAWAADTGTWTQLPLYERRLLCLAIDSLTPSTLYAGTGGSGVFCSTDSGTTWTAVNTGLTDPWIWSLAVNPLTPTTLYAGTDGHGVFRSTNSGTTWTAVNTGLTNPHVSSLAIHPLTPTTLYAGTTGGVFRSTNGGTTWTMANTGLTNPWIWSLAVNPLTPSTLYAGTVGGVFRSTNDGTTWIAVNTGLTDLWVLSLAINPLTPSTLFAGTAGSGVFRSTNNGTTWTAVNTGLTDPWIWSLAINPLTPSILYTGTGGSGVFRYDAVSSYALTTTTWPSAGGSIERSPDVLSYAAGTVVTLTAIPAAGYTFTGWSGDLSDTANPTTVRMDVNKTITAIFDIDTYTLTVNVSGSGSVAKFPDQATYSHGTSVQLIATPDAGWAFTGWTEDLTTVTNPVTLIVSRTQSIVAQFELVAPSLTSSLRIVVVGEGSVVRSPERDLFDPIETVELRAVPATGWTFTEWTGDLSGTIPMARLPMTSSKVVVAAFEQLPEEKIWNVAISSGTNGKVAPTGTQTVKDGGILRIEIQPNAGYQIDKLLVDSVSVSLSSTAAQSYNLGPVTTDRQVQCSFVAVPVVPKSRVVRLSIGSTRLTVDGQQTGLDAAPVIQNNRTLLPIRAIVEAFGGTIEWHAELRVVTMYLNGHEVSLQIGNGQGYVNGVQTAIDVSDSKVVPIIMSGRTLLPLRFVAENLGLQVEWNPATRTVTVQG
jgi:uncharacterized repeat protein (TIGR02543 family)